MSTDQPAGEYTVVARRYRPQRFDELVGQEHVAHALTQAIVTQRVGHAYLFTGARGVGKTSAARILAKALNCVDGPSPTPCNVCDVCQSITSGGDVDVLEIDGASNRGIDEIRQLRQNVAVRPIRTRFKVYIIDEVHMLTKDAFNALLKTLEEPPEHVKFVFATTEPNKIPITILSRCQRFDFAGIDARAIQTRLAQIAVAEGVEVEPEALQILSARAAGSMRDSQSLLEQLLAVADRQVTADDVNSLLGLAPAQRLSQLVRHLVERNAVLALAELDEALASGVEVGQLVDQLTGFFRDVMVMVVGCQQDQLRYALPAQADEVKSIADRLGVHTVLAIGQILDQTAARFRVSLHGRMLLEMALVRIACLEDLDDLAELVGQLQPTPDATPSHTTESSRGPAASPSIASGSAASRASSSSGPAPMPPSAQATNTSATTAPSAEVSRAAPVDIVEDAGQSVSIVSQAVTQDVAPVTDAQARDWWNGAIMSLSGVLASSAVCAKRISASGHNLLVASFPQKYSFDRELCDRPENKARLEQALQEFCGRNVRLSFASHADDSDSEAPRSTAPQLSRRQLRAEVAERPFVRRALEMFDVSPGQFDFQPPEASG